MEQLTENKITDGLSFEKKIWVGSAIVSLFIVTLLFIKVTIGVLLLVFAATLIALFFTGISNFIEEKTGWNETLCLSISIIGTLLILGGLFWLIGAKVADQVAQLIESLPSTIAQFKAKVASTSIGEKVLNTACSDKSMGKMQGLLSQFFQSTFGVFGDLYVIAFISIFFSISPKKYTDGIVALIPKGGQQKTRDLLAKLAEQLRNWLKGKLFAMFVVFVLTAIGLALMNMPLWLVLALLAGLLSFIPNFGPLMALIPAVLMALTEGTQKALMVVGLYILVQFAESNFITPFIQRKLLSLPLALILIAQLVMGALTGGWGLVMATPITVVAMVLVQELYVKPNNTEY